MTSPVPLQPSPGRKWNVPLTYSPKIQGVLDGKIRQTIRTGRKYSKGDLISFHGWEGKPYRSKWTDRTPYFLIFEVIDVYIEDGGIRREGHSLAKWTEPIMDCIAELDGIDPPTGEALGKVLLGLNKISPGEWVEAQIIRWDPWWRRERGSACS